ncbi:MAG: hypothetical protein ABSG68_12280 [Thermoguttaceae bacterium]|jgi:hypothetical protein
MRAVSNGEVDLLQLLLDMPARCGAGYCVIGGLAVNAYAEPVVSLDLDLVVVSDGIDKVCRLAASKGLKIQEFEHSTNLSMAGSDLRIQLRTDPRYQDFLPRAAKREVLGYAMMVASLQDVLRGKVWAYGDHRRRPSKRQKDLADIMRLVETHPQLAAELPRKSPRNSPVRSR